MRFKTQQASWYRPHCFRVCAWTHVESGSLSRLPRPGILKAFARLFFPPSGAKAVMYSSKPARATGHLTKMKNKWINNNINPHTCRNTFIGTVTHYTTNSSTFTLWFSVWVSSYFYCYVTAQVMFSLLFPTYRKQVRIGCTWPFFARALLLCKFLDEVIDANVFYVLLKFLVNLEQKRTG